MKTAREKITDILWWVSAPEHNCFLPDGNYCEDRASIHDYLSDILDKDGKNWSNVYDDIVDEIILLSNDCKED